MLSRYSTIGWGARLAANNAFLTPGSSLSGLPFAQLEDFC